jgi:hypothetical protein
MVIPDGQMERHALRDLDEIIEAIHGSTVYWNAHRHPFVWGQRRRHRPYRPPGIALLPTPA